MEEYDLKYILKLFVLVSALECVTCHYVIGQSGIPRTKHGGAVKEGFRAVRV